jgi:hypothetical protein
MRFITTVCVCLLLASEAGAELSSDVGTWKIGPDRLAWIPWYVTSNVPGGEQIPGVNWYVQTSTGEVPDMDISSWGCILHHNNTGIFTDRLDARTVTVQGAANPTALINGKTFVGGFQFSTVGLAVGTEVPVKFTGIEPELFPPTGLDTDMAGVPIAFTKITGTQDDAKISVAQITNLVWGGGQGHWTDENWLVDGVGSPVGPDPQSFATNYHIGKDDLVVSVGETYANNIYSEGKLYLTNWAVVWCDTLYVQGGTTYIGGNDPLNPGVPLSGSPVFAQGAVQFVPEPSTWAILLSAAALPSLWWYRRLGCCRLQRA